ncbi:hypothetical protein [Streptomyces antarcticus]|uniref:hypothetical protein n=1 Tax=Streptomyces antarcticus TaxID=2996458 RepID=UPI002270F3B1|nr:hypothetical protein [Streptomyces sp. H34-AA3]MCY0945371.1 hypothetical protein [Streptomyces sp. H34-AA3]
MFDTFEGVKVHVRAAEIVAAFAQCEQWSGQPAETSASGIVTATAVGYGEITTVTLGSNVGADERQQLALLTERLGRPLQDCVIVYKDICEWPHPRMKGSTSFIQFGIFQEERA